MVAGVRESNGSLVPMGEQSKNRGAKMKSPSSVISPKIFSGVCYHCGERRHLKYHCEKWKEEQRVYEDTLTNKNED